MANPAAPAAPTAPAAPAAPVAAAAGPALRMLDYFPSKFEGKSNDDAAAHWLEIRDYWAAHNTPPNRRAETFKLS